MPKQSIFITHTFRDMIEFAPESLSTVPIEIAHRYGVYEGEKFFRVGNLAVIGYHYPSRNYQIQSILEMRRK